MAQVYKTFIKPDGTKIQMKFRGKTQKEAEQKRDKAIWEYENGLLCYNDKTTLKAFADEWQERRNKLGKPLTEDAKRRLNDHILANIGGISVKEIRPRHVEMCLAEVAGSSQSNIDKTWNVLQQLFQAAQRDELLRRDPLEQVDKPKGTRKRRRPMTPEEQAAFMAVLHDSMTTTDKQRRYDLIFGITYACGLRPGEVRALSWPDIIMDSEQAQICVTQAVKTGGVEIGAPKTAAGVRNVYLPDWLLGYLRQYFSEWKEMRQHSAAQSLLLFPAKSGKPLTKKAVEIRWKRFLNRMDLFYGAQTYRNQIILHAPQIGQDLRHYYLRHTFRTNLAEWGINPLVAAYWMGHSDAAVNDIGYATVTPRMIKAAAQKAELKWQEYLNTILIPQTQKTPFNTGVLAIADKKVSV